MQCLNFVKTRTVGIFVTVFVREQNFRFVFIALNNYSFILAKLPTGVPSCRKPRDTGSEKFESPSGFGQLKRKVIFLAIHTGVFKCEYILYKRLTWSVRHSLFFGKDSKNNNKRHGKLN